MHSRTPARGAGVRCVAGFGGFGKCNVAVSPVAVALLACNVAGRNVAGVRGSEGAHIAVAPGVRDT